MRALLDFPKPKFSKEVAGDLETKGFSENVICACAVSEDGTVIRARSLREYVFELKCAGLLKPSVRHWFHNAGGFDALVILPWALRNGWRITKAIVSTGGSLWSLDLTDGYNIWCIRDSLRIAPASLKKIGEALGYFKKDLDASRIEEYPIDEVIDYCVRDCEVLLKAMLGFRDILRQYKGELLDTLAGSGAKIIRQLIPRDSWNWNRDTDTIGASAYYGGRVERFRRYAERGSVFDINSAYPWALTLPLPTRHIASGTGKPPGERLCIVRAKIRVTDSAFIGPLAYRVPRGTLKGRLVFPTGEWTGSYTLEELNAACETGECEYEVLSWHAWESEEWVKPLMRGWYDLRKSSTGYLPFALKILMNSVYGKFIEREEGESFTTDEYEARLAENKGKLVREHRFEEFPLWSIEDTHEGMVRHAALAAHVTARARITLLRAMRKCERLDYCDTDSVMGFTTMNSGNELGEFKHEYDYESAEFVAAKLYRLLKTDGNYVTKAKGYAKRDDMDSLWRDIVTGNKIHSESTRLFKTMVKKNKLEFVRDEKTRMKRDSTDKRCFVGNESRPWSIAELHSMM